MNVQHPQLTPSLTFAATHMVLASAMGRPSLNWPLLQHVCVCVLTAAIGLPKLLNVQNPQLTSSWTYLRHKWSANPQPGIRSILAGRKVTKMCVGQPLTLGCNPYLFYSALHMRVLTAAIGPLSREGRPSSPHTALAGAICALHSEFFTSEALKSGLCCPQAVLLWGLRRACNSGDGRL